MNAEGNPKAASCLHHNHTSTSQKIKYNTKTEQYKKNKPIKTSKD